MILTLWFHPETDGIDEAGQDDLLIIIHILPPKKGSPKKSLVAAFFIKA